LKREFLKTGDGSYTIHLPDWDEQYHSKHGAIVEAKHVFIETGLNFFLSEFPSEELEILEIGFGTGLNALLTSMSAETHKLPIRYTGVEAYPVITSEVKKLNYCQLLGIPAESFSKIHEVAWEKPAVISEYFTLTKEEKLFKDISASNQFDLIFFDAFGARVQPELWTESIFEKMFHAIKEEGVLVTYSAKGSVRRAMQAVGFRVERLPGPPGKREMLRARK